MFDDLARYQGELAHLFSEQFKQGQVAQTNLFSGPAYTLRMSFALECVRVLECQEEGMQTCGCSSCKQAHLLSHENLLIISKREHRFLIQSALSTYERLGTDFSQRMVIRALRTLLLAHHPQLSSLAEAAELNELVGQFALCSESEREERARWTEDLKRSTLRLLKAMKKNTTITVSQVRSIAEWVSRSAIGSDKRFIIIEAMEETGLSARNALLKILEEPPEGVYFFLISEHPSRIIETILSRSRHTRFPPLGQEALSRYLEPYYPTREYASLQEFVLESGGLNIQRMEENASQFAASIIDGSTLDTKELATLFGKLDGLEEFSHLLSSVIAHFERAVREQTLSSTRAQAMVRLASERYHQGQLYNQDVQMIGQGLYYALLEV